MLPFTFDCPGPECTAIPPHIAELATSNTSFLCPPMPPWGFRGVRRAKMSLLPTFASRKKLERSKWSRYFDSTWGLATLTDADFPLALRGFTYFRADWLPPPLRSLASKVAPLGRPRACYDMYTEMDPKYDAAANRPPALWLHAYPTVAPYARCTKRKSALGGGQCKGAHRPPDEPQRWPWPYGLPSHARVPVVRTCCDVPRKGFWLYLAVGSGAYFDLGRTLAFREHEDAMAYFGVPTALNWYDPEVEQAILRSPKARELDSIQYTHHAEHGLYKYEIMDLAGSAADAVQRDACPLPANAARYHGGWRGRAPCRCPEGSTFLQCVPGG